MRKISLIIFILFFANRCLAQTNAQACNTFKSGKFYYIDSLAYPVFVKRKKNRQYEFDSYTKVKSMSKIWWISDCSYGLKLLWSDSKAERKKSMGSVTTVVITKIIGNNEAYEYSCGCADSTIRLKSIGIMRRQNN